MKWALPLISYILGAPPDQFCNCKQSNKNVRKDEKTKKAEKI